MKIRRSTRTSRTVQSYAARVPPVGWQGVEPRCSGTGDVPPVSGYRIQPGVLLVGSGPIQLCLLDLQGNPLGAVKATYPMLLDQRLDGDDAIALHGQPTRGFLREDRPERLRFEGQPGTLQTVLGVLRQRDEHGQRIRVDIGHPFPTRGVDTGWLYDRSMTNVLVRDVVRFG